MPATHESVVCRDQWTLVAIGPEIEIDAIQKALVQAGAEDAAELPGQAIEVDHRRRALGVATRGRGFAQMHEIDVRRVVELAGAEFSEAEGAEAQRLHGPSGIS
ncbi:MAG: hypothetical protein JRG94_17950, partial [Deltaproteobacteria bacterium]|nr:hypothetical protein [Deltaproteobacteria bacterium]